MDLNKKPPILAISFSISVVFASLLRGLQTRLGGPDADPPSFWRQLRALMDESSIAFWTVVSMVVLMVGLLVLIPYGIRKWIQLRKGARVKEREIVENAVQMQADRAGDIARGEVTE